MRGKIRSTRQSVDSEKSGLNTSKVFYRGSQVGGSISLEKKNTDRLAPLPELQQLSKTQIGIHNFTERNLKKSVKFESGNKSMQATKPSLITDDFQL